MTLSELSPLANHLWQSTVFAVAAWMLTLALRKNRASVRYWIWFAASVKFLIPFSLLVGIGNRFAWHSSVAFAQPQFTNVINQISRPFATFTQPSTSSVAPHASSALPIILLATWFCGVIAILIFWLRSLQQIRAIKRAASPLPLNLPVPVMSSQARMEPGVFGILHPVLILPGGITDRLTPAQLNSVIAHELCHVQRKDNLTAAIHMLVETVFWFHPFVWWIQSRLVAERERSCDESVVSIANDPQIYAEAILNVCKFYVESPLECVSGVTGADLKRRIVRIMSKGASRKLDFSKKLLLGAAGMAVVSVPLLLGLANAAPNRAQSDASDDKYAAFVYDVVSIKPYKGDPRGFHPGGTTPDGFSLTAVPLRNLIDGAFATEEHFADSGVPAWLHEEHYDIEAKMDIEVAAALQKLNPAEQKLARRHMMKMLLQDRLKLVVHLESKEVPAYDLVVAKNGPKLKESVDPNASDRGLSVPVNQGGAYVRTFKSVQIGSLAGFLSGTTGRPVNDKTGLTGTYDFTLKWAPDRLVANAPGEISTESDTPFIAKAIEEQLGLKFVPSKGSMQIVVIDHVERPSGN